ncbi:MAG: hypothetical protein K8T25_15135 [Planctomycetia bacterium]|nr:hypothetical protein [Planctomycetia bacterium]
MSRIETRRERRNRSSKLLCVAAAGALAAVAMPGVAEAALANLGDFSVASIEPASNTFSGGAVAFIPANEDSINQNSLVINWRVKDTIDTTKFNTVFQRITIPASGGTPTLLATATIRWDMLYDGSHKFSADTRPNDLVYDVDSNKLVTFASSADSGGGHRMFWLDLFAGDTVIDTQGELGYSAANGDNAAASMARSIVKTPDGKYTYFYPFSTNWIKAAVDITGGNNAAVTKTTIAKSSFTGWYPDTSAVPYTNGGFDCEGGVASGDKLLLIRDYRNGATGPYESHLYEISNAFDAAAINAYTDLGNMTPTSPVNGQSYANLTAYGIAVNGSTAYVHYAVTNDIATTNRILMISVPEPTGLAALLAPGALMAIRRRRRD